MVLLGSSNFSQGSMFHISPLSSWWLASSSTPSLKVSWWPILFFLPLYKSHAIKNLWPDHGPFVTSATAVDVLLASSVFWNWILEKKILPLLISSSSFWWLCTWGGASNISQLFDHDNICQNASLVNSAQSGNSKSGSCYSKPCPLFISKPGAGSLMK